MTLIDSIVAVEQDEIRTDMRQKVERLSNEMLKHQQVEVPLRHFFGGGMYAREMTLQKGTYWTGKIHKQEQINILSKGDITVLTQDGPIRVQAPFTIVSPAGVRRAGYAHEECVWTTILKTDLTDPEECEKQLVSASEEEYQTYLLEAK